MPIRRFIKIDDPSKDTPRAFSDFQNPFAAELLRSLLLAYQAASEGVFSYDTKGRVTQIVVSGLGEDGAGNPMTATLTYTYDDETGTNTGVPDALWKETLEMDLEYDRDVGTVQNTVQIQTVFTYDPGNANRLTGYERTEL